MGKHANTAVAVRPSRPFFVRSSSRPVDKAPMHGRIALSLFGFLAAFAFVLVNVTDPYAGATASPYYQAPGAPLTAKQVQELAAATTYELPQAARDAFTVEEKPVIVLPPPAPAASSSDSGGDYTPPRAVADPGSAQAIGAEMVAARGWGSEQFDCLAALWNRESGWRVNAYNPSGAYGIPQALPGSKMASSGADWETNPATQIDWGLNYIAGRYGSPCGAWAHSEDVGWY